MRTQYQHLWLSSSAPRIARPPRKRYQSREAIELLRKEPLDPIESTRVFWIRDSLFVSLATGA